MGIANLIAGKKVSVLFVRTFLHPLSLTRSCISHLKAIAEAGGVGILMDRLDDKDDIKNYALQALTNLFSNETIRHQVKAIEDNVIKIRSLTKSPDPIIAYSAALCLVRIYVHVLICDQPSKHWQCAILTTYYIDCILRKKFFGRLSFYLKIRCWHDQRLYKYNNEAQVVCVHDERMCLRTGLAHVQGSPRDAVTSK